MLPFGTHQIIELADLKQTDRLLDAEARHVYLIVVDVLIVEQDHDCLVELAWACFDILLGILQYLQWRLV